tara:strand:- start:16 stop:615 length:600 start_codon:yes stop_codon:yes gene_type:complete
MTQFQKHHIVPKYKCKELGIDPEFEDNYCYPIRHQHALIHWGYKCNDLKPLFEVCNPPQYVIDMIPLGDNRDVGAATIIARGEIEGIDISGENNPMWKGGIATGDNLKEYMKAYKQTPKSKEYLKAYQQTPKMKEWHKAYKQTPKHKEYRQTPKYKESQKVYMRKQYAKNKAETGYAKGYSQAKKKIERKGQGTLEQFL